MSSIQTYLNSRDMFHHQHISLHFPNPVFPQILLPCAILFQPLPRCGYNHSRSRETSDESRSSQVRPSLPLHEPLPSSRGCIPPHREYKRLPQKCTSRRHRIYAEFPSPHNRYTLLYYAPQALPEYDLPQFCLLCAPSSSLPVSHWSQ